MSFHQCLIAYWTIIRIEIIRLFRVWKQTLVPPAMTSILYFIIFGHVIGGRVGPIDHLSYAAFIAPGLIMMQMITSSYSASVFSFYFAKFSRSIEEILVSPMSNSLILLAFMSVGVARGLIVGVIVTLIASFFVHMPFFSIVIMLLVAVVATAIFSLCGLINGVFAKSFDDIAVIPNFVITPLTYFAGVFYSIRMLPPFFRHLSLVNPIYYIVDSFRYALLGASSATVGISVGILLILFLMIFFGCLILFRFGAGLRP